MRLLPRIAVTIISCWSATVAAENSYLFMIPAERLDGESGRLSTSVKATLHVPDGERAAGIIASGGALEIVAADAEQITIIVGAAETMAEPPDAGDLRQSFVIDFDEAAVETVLSEVRANLGEKPGIAELTEFVFNYIDNKAYLGTFDLASKVAARRTGDCTEHAVLLTALARANGYPARVAIGVALLESAGRVAAYGHAWTEIHDGSAWQLADATMPEGEAQVTSVRYLPLMNLDNEGPGFSLDLARLGQIQPAKVTEIRNAP
ncbi:MAG: transglutaminase-like domain-containing protein [Gammaproteobacteria bacterium]|nr:transglutaminase-like domain-containing protein [Gammaproteobacteria bacterium]